MDLLSPICTFCGRVMRARLADMLVLSLFFMCVAGASMKINLAELINARKLENAKRGSDNNNENIIGGNPCIDYPDHPFPCKKTSQCLPFRYICDKNYDCDDGSDEDTAMCTASQRPPIEEIKHFLEKESDWLIPELFADRPIGAVAHALAVSPTLSDLQRILKLSKEQIYKFRDSMQAVADNHEGPFEVIGMPPGSWPEVKYIFNNLMENGFGKM